MKNRVIVILFVLVISLQCSQNDQDSRDGMVALRLPASFYSKHQLGDIDEQLDCKKEAFGAVACCFCFGLARVSACACRVSRNQEWTKICNECSDICFSDAYMCWYNVRSTVYTQYNLFARECKNN